MSLQSFIGESERPRATMNVTSVGFTPNATLPMKTTSIAMMEQSIRKAMESGSQPNRMTVSPMFHRLLIRATAPKKSLTAKRRFPGQTKVSHRVFDKLAMHFRKRNYLDKVRPSLAIATARSIVFLRDPSRHMAP